MGGRNAHKRTEALGQKDVGVIFLQDTHSDAMNETDWNLVEGPVCLLSWY